MSLLPACRLTKPSMGWLLLSFLTFSLLLPFSSAFGVSSRALVGKASSRDVVGSRRSMLEADTAAAVVNAATAVAAGPTWQSVAQDILRNGGVGIAVTSALIGAAATVNNSKLDSQDKLMEMKFESIQSGIQETNKKLDTVDKKVDAVDKKVDRVDKKVDAVDKKVDAVDKKVDAVHKKVDMVKADIQSDIRDIRSDIRDTNNKLDYQDKLVETKLESLKTNIQLDIRDMVNANNQSLKADIGKIQTEVGRLNSDFVILKTNSHQINMKVEKLTLDLQSQKTAIPKGGEEKLTMDLQSPKTDSGEAQGEGEGKQSKS